MSVSNISDDAMTRALAAFLPSKPVEEMTLDEFRQHCKEHDAAYAALAYGTGAFQKPSGRNGMVIVKNPIEVPFNNPIHRKGAA